MRELRLQSPMRQLFWKENPSIDDVSLIIEQPKKVPPENPRSFPIEYLEFLSCRQSRHDSFRPAPAFKAITLNSIGPSAT